MSTLKEGSIADRLAKLDIGDTYSVTKMFDLSPQTGEEITQMKRRLRNALTKHQDRASQASGAMFRLDTGQWFSHDNGTMFLTVAITRIN